MASYIDANPEEAECVAAWRKTGQMVPIVRDGVLKCLVNRRNLDAMRPAVPLSVEDCVVGLEVMGFSFQLRTLWNGGRETIQRSEPEETLPPAWRQHALRIMETFGTGRWGEVVEFLSMRNRGDDVSR